ncbi:D-alanine--D-alanine ligase family protein [Collinsella vaginalis]|uniref:D-alanine--D-alanine ligase family protein n=1 Tax=Collinsella vaginalis TaxID=1870987 RepID=UPI000A27164E|nr:D-alanine--D-alanine ligase family protein [Collinsella vaginalis]
MLNVAIIFGGISSEHDISLKSAGNVIASLPADRFTPIMIGIDRDGAWFHYTGDPADIVTGAWETHDVSPVVLIPGRGEEAQGGLMELVDETFHELDIDVAFPVLHGQGGEDGTVQGTLETCGIPYVGCGVLASAACMDKDVAHRLAAAAGVRSPRCTTLHRGADLEEARAAVALCGGFPVFVKPARGGSSIGVSKAADEDELASALKLAFDLDPKLAVEEAIEGVEVGCAVIGEAGRGIEMGEVDEIVVTGGGFFRIHLEQDPSANTELRCPSTLPAVTLDRVRAAGMAVYEALNCSGFARVDLFVTGEGEVVFNEVNSTPGLTTYSRFPQMMRAAGREFPDVLTELILDALKAV